MSDVLNQEAQGRLKAFVAAHEQLDREMADLREAQRDLLAEVRAKGFDVAVFKEAVKVRRQDATARAEHGAVLALYLAAAQ